MAQPPSSALFVLIIARMAFPLVCSFARREWPRKGGPQLLVYGEFGALEALVGIERLVAADRLEVRGFRLRTTTNGRVRSTRARNCVMIQTLPSFAGARSKIVWRAG